MGVIHQMVQNQNIVACYTPSRTYNLSEPTSPIMICVKNNPFYITKLVWKNKLKNLSRTKPQENCPKVGFYLPKGIWIKGLFAFDR
jgi:hypothetical protein